MNDLTNERSALYNSSIINNYILNQLEAYYEPHHTRE